MTNPRNVVAAFIISAMPVGALAADGVDYPYVEGGLELELGNDHVLRADEPGEELNDLFVEGALGMAFVLTPNLTVNTGLTLEPVDDPAPFTDRYFGDLGLYMDTLNLQAGLGPTTFTAGKFTAGFGTAWDAAPGIYGTEFAEDYELAEQVGFGLAYSLKTATMGTHTLGANIFYADRSPLSDSIFTRRGRLVAADGGAGNTGRLDNVSITLDGTDFEALPGLSYHLGYRYLSAGLGDAGDENGFVAGIAHESELGGNVTLGAMAEVAHFTNFAGTADDATYATSGLSLQKGPWHGELTGTIRRLHPAGGGGRTDRLVQVSGGYGFENGLDISAGYAFARESGENAHTVGLRLSKAFDFSTR